MSNQYARGMNSNYGLNALERMTMEQLKERYDDIQLCEVRDDAIIIDAHVTGRQQDIRLTHKAIIIEDMSITEVVKNLSLGNAVTLKEYVRQCYVYGYREMDLVHLVDNYFQAFCEVNLLRSRRIFTIRLGKDEGVEVGQSLTKEDGIKIMLDHVDGYAQNLITKLVHTRARYYTALAHATISVGIASPDQEKIKASEEKRLLQRAAGESGYRTVDIPTVQSVKAEFDSGLTTYERIVPMVEAQYIPRYTVVSPTGLVKDAHTENEFMLLLAKHL